MFGVGSILDIPFDSLELKVACLTNLLYENRDNEHRYPYPVTEILVLFREIGS
jgi:hypothetical protein